MRPPRRLDGPTQADLAARVHAISQQDQRLAPFLLAHQLIGRQEDSVIQCGTSAATMPTAAATSLRAAARLVELRHVKFLQRRFQLLVRRGQVLQQLDVPIKMDDEGLVLFRTHQVVQEAIAGRALLLQHASLTHAGVNQQTKRERQVRIFGEVTDGLRMAVLLQLEVVLGQVVDDLAVLVAHRGQHVDHLDVGGKRRRFLAGGRLLTRRRLLAWKSGPSQQQEKRRRQPT